jgi:hypothetical protein
MTHGKIEDYHRAMKNRFKRENYYYPCGLQQSIGDWAQHYNQERDHESAGSVAPADVYHGRKKESGINR